MSLRIGIQSSNSNVYNGESLLAELQPRRYQVDPRYTGFEAYVQPEDIDYALQHPTDTRLFAIAHAMYNLNYPVDMIHELTKIDKVSVVVST